MPEGHSIHRVARQFALHFVGHRVEASSPQGRFAGGAKQLDGRTMTDARAVGKQMFLEFDHELWLHVHLGMFGAWDFAGEVTTDLGSASAARAEASGGIAQNEASLSSIGAPRRTRLRMSEQETLRQEQGDDFVEPHFPPEPVGAVRVRLLTATSVADLRGPTTCEVQLPEQMVASVNKLGPDPLEVKPKEGEERFLANVRTKPTPIALLLMDQSVVSGIGNVYRAELLFRARIEPHTPGKQLAEDTIRALWKDWTYLLKLGVKTGHMMTMDGLKPAAQKKALANRADRHWVYHRTGEPCRVCGTPIAMEVIGGRKLYWCPKDQT